MVDGIVVEQVGGNDRLDDLVHDLLAQIFGGDLLSVLSGDDNSVDADWRNGASAVRVLLVLDGDLRL